MVAKSASNASQGEKVVVPVAKELPVKKKGIKETKPQSKELPIQKEKKSMRRTVGKTRP
jgi:hypothetical protein